MTEKRETVVTPRPRNRSPYQELALRFIPSAPGSTVTANSELVERTKGIMAALSPTVTASSLHAPSRASSTYRSTSFTFLKPARLMPLSQLMSTAIPARWSITQKSSDKGRGRPLDEFSSKSTVAVPDAAITSDSPVEVLDISREAMSKMEFETSIPEDSVVQESSPEPPYLELAISDTSSILSMSNYVASVFGHQPSPNSTDRFSARETQDDETLQDPTANSTVESAEHEDLEQELDLPMDWNSLIARESGEVSIISPLEFSRDGDVSSVEYAERGYASWNVRSRSPHRPPMTWAPPGSSEAQRPEHPHRPTLDEYSRTNTASSLDECLKPLTYLVHHQKTSSIDVCSSSDHAKASSEGCLPSSEGTLDIEEASIKADPPQLVRVRKYGWQEPAAVLEIIPRLVDLTLGNHRK